MSAWCPNRGLGWIGILIAQERPCKVDQYSTIVLKGEEGVGGIKGIGEKGGRINMNDMKKMKKG